MQAVRMCVANSRYLTDYSFLILMAIPSIVYFSCNIYFVWSRSFIFDVTDIRQCPRTFLDCLGHSVILIGSIHILERHSLTATCGRIPPCCDCFELGDRYIECTANPRIFASTCLFCVCVCVYVRLCFVVVLYPRKG